MNYYINIENVHKFEIRNKTSHKTESLPGEVPDSNRAGNDELLTRKNKLRRPQQSNQMYPPEMSSKSMCLIVNTFKTGLIAHDRRPCTTIHDIRQCRTNNLYKITITLTNMKQ